MKKKVLIIALIIVLMSMYSIVNATTISEYQNQIKQTESDKQNAEENLESITAEKNSVQEQVSSLNESIGKVQSELSDLEDKINELDNSIKENEKELSTKQRLLEERLVAKYMNGNNTYLDALFSGGISSFVSKFEAIKQIAEYDNNLINEVKGIKTELENERAELEESKTQIEDKKNDLESKKTEREKKVELLSDEEKSAQAEIEQKEEELNKINEAVKIAQKKIEEENKKPVTKPTENTPTNKPTNTHTNKTNVTNNNNTTTITSSSGGMTWPTRLTHKINSIYAPGGRNDTTGYVGTAHKGLDIYAPSGEPIYAAKSGTVVYVNYKGYGGGWGLYVVIYHGKDSNGKALYTRYAHASAIASGISVGTKVDTNTVIMYSGATGAAEGAHLHFEVCLNSMYNQVNPCPYLGVSNARGTY